MIVMKFLMMMIILIIFWNVYDDGDDDGDVDDDDDGDDDDDDHVRRMQASALSSRAWDAFRVPLLLLLFHNDDVGDDWKNDQDDGNDCDWSYSSPSPLFIRVPLLLLLKRSEEGEHHEEGKTYWSFWLRAF